MWNVCQGFFFSISIVSLSRCDERVWFERQRLTINLSEEVPHSSNLIYFYRHSHALKNLSECRWNRWNDYSCTNTDFTITFVYLFVHSRVRKISSLVPPPRSGIVFVLFFIISLTHFSSLKSWIAFKVEQWVMKT